MNVIDKIQINEQITIEYKINDNDCWIPTNRRINDKGDVPCKLKYNNHKYSSIVRLVYDYYKNTYTETTIKLKKTCGTRCCVNPSHLMEYVKGDWRIDEIGKKYNRFTVIEFEGDITKRSSYVTCICECGEILNVNIHNLRSGKTKSCGCYRDELASDKNGTHRMSKTRLYKIYNKIKERCYTPSCERYKNYGGRGIVMCKEWLDDFMSFHEWAVNNGYEDHLSIERIDIDGNYCPENCKWITMKEQAYNKQNTFWVEYNGEHISLSKLLKQLGLYNKMGAIKKRMSVNGIPLEDAIKVNNRKETNIMTIKHKLIKSRMANMKITIDDLSTISEISKDTLLKSYISDSLFKGILLELNLEVLL